MKYYVFAFYQEAEDMIQKYDCHKEMNIQYMDVFSSENHTVLITGVGVFASVKHLSRYFNQKQIQRDDLIFSIGGAGTYSYPLGKVFLIHQLQMTNQRDLFPDVLYHHPFIESSLQTIWRNEGYAINKNLFDMEGYGVYEALRDFFDADQIIFIKITTDFVDKKTNAESYFHNYKMGMASIINFTEALHRYLPYMNRMKEKDINEIINYCSHFTSYSLCSQAMKVEFQKRIEFALCFLSKEDTLLELDTFLHKEYKEKQQRKQGLEEMYEALEAKSYLSRKKRS